MNLYEFMSDSPALTFLLVLLIVVGIVNLVRAITGNYPAGNRDE